MIVGVVGALVGLCALVLGAVVSIGASAVSTVSADAKSKTPQPVAFETKRARYEIFAVHERRGSIGAAASFECEVTFGSGRSVTVDGSSRAVSDEVANTQRIGSFEAEAGVTTVACDAGRDGETFIVDEESPWRRFGFFATLAGAVVLLVSAGVIVFGVFSKVPSKA